MKKLFSSMLIVTMLFMASSTVYGAGVSIKVDGITITSDVQPESKNNRTMVPLRVISEHLGASVDWTNPKVTITNDNNIIVLNVNSDIVEANGQQLKLDVKPYVNNNRVLVPIRFIAEIFGSKVNYTDKTVTITTEPFIINGTKVTALQQEYRMTLGSIVQQVDGNVYTKEIYKTFEQNIGSQVEAPANYSWTINFDIPGSYYKNGQYDFVDPQGNSVIRYDIYTINDASPAEILAEYPHVVIFNATQNKWYLFTKEANQTITELIYKASVNGFLKLISST